METRERREALDSRLIAARPGATLSGLAESPGQKDLIALAIGFAALGDEESALDWLETAYESRADWFPRIAARVTAGDFGASRAALLELRRFRTLVSHLESPETD